jgi:hypothetical protein
MLFIGYLSILSDSFKVIFVAKSNKSQMIFNPLCQCDWDFIECSVKPRRSGGVGIYTTFSQNKNNELQKHQAPSPVKEGSIRVRVRVRIIKSSS